MKQQLTPPEIGPRLQALRKERKLTLADLSVMAGVSRSILSEIERGNANPTYGTLWHLTQALGVNLDCLMGGVTNERTDQIHLLPGNLTPTIRSPDGTCTLQILAPASMIALIEWYLLNFDLNGKLESEAHSPGTMEHLHCLEGEIHVSNTASQTVVRAGETARYSAEVPHCLTSIGSQPAKAFLVVAFAGVNGGFGSTLRPK
ncbi:XRE family transcriptional regulator [Pseudochrobactrum sp. sp1633]|uniref:helix-turn-helix domain-containing protein n=1 Tax=Pseudochrobactrum sp. sp1633 TaxID=3036706 RepID=UPI0025A4F9A8|nr:XRE family transcriptional regulator [Pseudochrobactrum sp. sp1633]MDM8346316.1 XRE family transcriptional regulator [Pseudochrobactrum sp. sp1633]HWD14103.1 XRE family transcriptional regulator [Pseudochrobactrum sp.]